MDVNTFNNLKQLNVITEMVEEYRDLIRLSSPSDEQLDRIEEILELAIYNTQLANFLNKVDEELAQEISSLSNNNLSPAEFQPDEEVSIIFFSGHACNKNSEDAPDHNFQSIQGLPSRNGAEPFCLSIKNTQGRKPSQQIGDNSNLIKFPHLQILDSCESSPGKDSRGRLSQKLSENESMLIKNEEQDLKTDSRVFQKDKWEWRNNIKPLCYLAGGFFILLAAPGLYGVLNITKGGVGNTHRDYSVISYISPPQQAASETTKELVNVSEAKVSICDAHSDNFSEEMQKYYALYSKLEKQVENQTLKPLDIKMQVQYLQKSAEREQRQLEEEQRYAEIEKRQAERQKSYDVAQKWKDKASNSLAESRQWLCFSRYALTLIR